MGGPTSKGSGGERGGEREGPKLLLKQGPSENLATPLNFEDRRQKGARPHNS